MPYSFSISSEINLMSHLSPQDSTIGAHAISIFFLKKDARCLEIITKMTRQKLIWDQSPCQAGFCIPGVNAMRAGQWHKDGAHREVMRKAGGYDRFI